MRSLIFTVRTALLASGGLLLPALVVAEPAPPYAVLLREAQATAPRLIESGANVRSAEGLAAQAGALPNPTVSLDVEDLGIRDSNGIGQRQTTLSVSQPLELGGKRAARIGAGRADVGVAEARQHQAKADFAYDLALAYAAAEAGQAHAALLTEDLGRAREDLRAARALVEAGKEADVRALQAQAAATGAEADLAAARADAAEAFARLTSMVGALEPFTSISASLLVRTQALRPATATPSNTPGVAVAQAEREAATRRLRVERARMTPDLTVSVGARKFEARDGAALVVGLAAPLPLFDRNRGAVTSASALVVAADARLKGARLDAEAGWRAASAQAAAGETRVEAATQAAAAAREGYRLTRIGYDSGKSSLMELSAARRSLAEAQTRLIDARVARVRAEAQLARLAGRTPFGE